jgi:hypothetical protein
MAIMATPVAPPLFFFINALVKEMFRKTFWGA